KTYNCIERSGFSGAIRSQKAHDLALQNLKTDSVDYASATVGFPNFVGGQRVHLSCHLRLSDGRGGFSSFNQHPIIVSVESQRIACNSASFGIKNARSSAR